MVYAVITLIRACLELIKANTRRWKHIDRGWRLVPDQVAPPGSRVMSSSEKSDGGGCADVPGGGGVGDLGSIMPVCVCPKVKEMGSFSALSEQNE